MKSEASSLEALDRLERGVSGWKAAEKEVGSRRDTKKWLVSRSQAASQDGLSYCLAKVFGVH